MWGLHGAPRHRFPLLWLGLLLSLVVTEYGAEGLRTGKGLRPNKGGRKGLKTQHNRNGKQHRGSSKASSVENFDKGRTKRINTLAKKLQTSLSGGGVPQYDLVKDYVWQNGGGADKKRRNEVSFLENDKLSGMDPWAPSPASPGNGGFIPPRQMPPPGAGHWDDEANMWAPSPLDGAPSEIPWGETLDVHKSSVRRSPTKSRRSQGHDTTAEDEYEQTRAEDAYGQPEPAFGPPGISSIPPPDGTSGLAPGLGNGLASMIMADPNQKPPVANRFSGAAPPPGYPYPPPVDFGPYASPWWAYQPTLPPIRIPPGWPQPPSDPLRNPPPGGPSPNPRIGRRGRLRRERRRMRDRLLRGGPPDYVYPDYRRPNYQFPSYPAYPDFYNDPWYAYSPTLPPIRFPPGRGPPPDPFSPPPPGGPSPAGWMEPTLPPIRIPAGVPPPPGNPLARPPGGGPSPAWVQGGYPTDPYDPFDPYYGSSGMMGAYSVKDGPGGAYPPPDPSSAVYSAVAQGAATAAQANAEEAAKQAMDSLVAKGLYGGYKPR